MSSVNRMEGEPRMEQWFPITVLGLLLFASVFKIEILGLNVSGWAWLVGLLAAGGVLLKAGMAKVSLPFQYWVPWVLMVVLYIGWWFNNAVQSAVQILCPLVVGMAASTLRPSGEQTRKLLHIFRWLGVAFLGVVLFLRVPMLLLGKLPETTGLAPEAMSAMLFQSIFLCSYLLQRKRTDLLLYLACAALPVVALVRGPILGSLALLLLTVAPLSLSRRVLIAVAAAVIGLVVFNMPRVQQKMFWSGRGQIEDLRWNNPDLRKHTRDLMWRRLWSGVQEKPWFGHGGNADATDLLAAGFPIYLPHNDWLRILFNYGIVGCSLYAGAMLLQIRHGWRWSAISSLHTQILLYAGLSAFVPYAVVMFTDNILIYVPYYGNIHFLLLGLAYGSLAVALEQEPASET